MSRHRRPFRDENHIMARLLGAVAGGVIGHQFGGGRGKDVATVVRGAGRRLCWQSNPRINAKVIPTLPRSNAGKTIV